MKYKEEDFELDRIGTEFDDYWFKVKGQSAKIIERDNMEVFMVCVPEVVYSFPEKVVCVKRLFPFNYDVVFSDDDELKALLSHLCTQEKARLNKTNI